MNGQQRLAGVFEREWHRFISYVRRKMVGLSYMDAEDIVADVMLNLFDRADVSAHIENLTAYAYRAIANRISDYWRRRRSTISLDDPDSENAILLQGKGGSAGDSEEVLWREDVRARLYDAINALDPKQRAVWVATEIEGRSFKELAAVWNEPVGTLLSRKSRATKVLRSLLKDLMTND